MRIQLSGSSHYKTERYVPSFTVSGSRPTLYLVGSGSRVCVNVRACVRACVCVEWSLRRAFARHLKSLRVVMHYVDVDSQN
jgi:hypothetical protein